MTTVNWGLTQAKCTRAELDAAIASNAITIGRLYHLTDEDNLVLGIAVNAVREYMPARTAPGDADPTTQSKLAITSISMAAFLQLSVDSQLTPGKLYFVPDAEVGESYIVYAISATEWEIVGISDRLLHDLATDGHEILFTNENAEEQGALGFLEDPVSGDAVYFARTETGSYDPKDGALALRSGKAELYGSTLIVDSLRDPDGTKLKQVLVSPTDGQLVGADMPEPGWEVSATDGTDTDLGSGSAQGPWVKLANLEVSFPEDVTTGQRLDAHINLDILVTAGSGELHVGIGFDGAQPTSHDKFVLTEGFDGYKAISISSLASADYPSGTALAVWCRRGASLGAGFSGQWDIQYSTGNPGRKEAYAYLSGQHRISHYDDPGEVDRQAELEGIQPGWTFSYSGFSDTVESISHQNNHVRITPVGTGRGDEGQHSITFGPVFALSLTGSSEGHEFLLSTPGEGGSGVALPAQVTDQERADGTETSLRSFSPEDVAVMANLHGFWLGPTRVTESRAITAADHAHELLVDSQNAVNLTLAPGLLVGFRVLVTRYGTGAVTIIPDASDLLNGSASPISIDSQFNDVRITRHS